MPHIPINNEFFDTRLNYDDNATNIKILSKKKLESLNHMLLNRQQEVHHAVLIKDDINKEIINKLDKILSKKQISELIDSVYRYCGQKETVVFCDKIKRLGFLHAFKAAISFGKDDLIIPKTKEKLVNDAKKQIESYESQYSEGLITRGEKYNKVVDVWSKCTDLVANEMMKEISSATKVMDNDRIETNSVFLMANSGARGSAAQMKQLAGMRGLIAKPSGEIIETPITANFKEGLTALEYFNSTHGARKGLADTALKTANSGYLTRRLCDVAQDLTITKIKCDNPGHLSLSEIIEGGNVIVSLSERSLGRVTATEVKNPISGEVILKKSEMIDEFACDKIDSAGVKVIKVYSVITCSSKKGVCATCYGRDLSRGKMVHVGEAIGMISAQSIGEPGTQLTMRTFHVGGTASIKQESQIVTKSEGILKVINTNLLQDSKKNLIVMGRNTQLSLEDENGLQIAIYKVPYGSKLF